MPNMTIEDGKSDRGKEESPTPLNELRSQEQRLWHKLEMLLVRHAMKVAQSPAVTGAIKLIDAVEEFRETAHEIAEGIREATMIIRQEILLEAPGIATDALAARVDEVLKERIKFHFKPITPEIDKEEK